jgi:molybdopterin-guanine dinucleotide biosynthesis protein B/molybdopterin-guanine dinucleotide biosynthesis protein
MADRTDKHVSIGVLLAGGGARRAGVDKRFLVLEGRTLLQRNLAFLHDLFPTVVLSLAPGHQFDLGDAAALGETVIVNDDWPSSSPLAGIATVLARYRAPVFTLAVDMAFPSRAASARVLSAFPGHDAAVPAVGRHFQPLFAVYGPGCLGPMTAMLEAGQQRIIDAYHAIDLAPVAFESDGPFHSINTMDEYGEARDLSGSADTGPGDAAPGAEARPAPETASALAAPDAGPALVAVVGKSDSGKTTLIEKLVPELVRLGLKVGTVKHDAHSFEIDHPGKDTWRHGQAGAQAYVIASPERLAYITRLDGEVPLATIARRYFAGFDLVVAEGYKRTAPHRVEIFRAAAGHEAPLCGPGEALALVTDSPLPHDHRFGLDEARDTARFLAMRLDTLRHY